MTVSLVKAYKLVGHSSKLLSTMAFSTFKTLSVTIPSDFVAHVELNRPEKRNAMNRTMWFEIGDCFRELTDSPDCRVVILSGAGGKAFTAGIDFQDMLALGSELSDQPDVARKARVVSKLIRRYQEGLTALEKCPKPVIAAVNGFCIGGGLNLICAADIRYCSKDAVFQNKEVAIGMASDVGTSQRMPKIIGSMSLMNELAFTGRQMLANEAKECGLVNRVYDDNESLIQGALEVAKAIAAQSPVAVQGTKRNIIFSRDYGIEAGLEHILIHNMSMLQSDDFLQAVTATATKGEPPTFSKL